MKLTTAHAEQTTDRNTGFMDWLRPLLTHASFSSAATEFLTRLAQSTGCERASLGFVTRKAIRICAVSQYYQGMKDSILPEVTAAMEESLLQDTALHYPDPLNDFPHIVLAHAELARCNGLSSVFTIPLAEDGQLIGAITLESRRKNGFDRELLASLQQLAVDAGPLLKLKWTLDQPLPVRCATAVRAAVTRGSLASLRTRHVAAGFVALCAAAVFLLPVSNRVSGQARLEASVQRVITSPIDGYLKEVRVRPGDRVQASQSLAELNDEALHVERRRLDAEAVQQENALAEAMVKADRTQVALRRAKLDEVIAQRELVAQQLERTQLIAPFDGVVIKGDLTQLLGSPLKRGDVLLTVSQGSEFRVMVEVPERDISGVKLGQAGKLVLTALPDQAFGIRIARITPVAGISSDGENVFEVEAQLDADAAAAALVPGLKGVAKITTGHTPIGWQWAARAWHALSFIVWSRLG
ncbi:efflux RND transporter periplasmic adaptor subunit [Noviherbaspirillum cavernae]|nr:efflux RND transporter periplasmic adaptor subunit [Noviherbaspirillum cavernae]